METDFQLHGTQILRNNYNKLARIIKHAAFRGTKEIWLVFFLFLFLFFFSEVRTLIINSYSQTFSSWKEQDRRHTILASFAISFISSYAQTGTGTTVYRSYHRLWYQFLARNNKIYRNWVILKSSNSIADSPPSHHHRLSYILFVVAKIKLFVGIFFCTLHFFTIIYCLFIFTK